MQDAHRGGSGARSISAEPWRLGVEPLIPAQAACLRLSWCCCASLAGSCVEQTQQARHRHDARAGGVDPLQSPTGCGVADTSSDSLLAPVVVLLHQPGT